MTIDEVNKARVTMTIKHETLEWWRREAIRQRRSLSEMVNIVLDQRQAVLERGRKHDDHEADV